jgi:hypothetical protein
MRILAFLLRNLLPVILRRFMPTLIRIIKSMLRR